MGSQTCQECRSPRGIQHCMGMLQARPLSKRHGIPLHSMSKHHLPLLQPLNSTLHSEGCKASSMPEEQPALGLAPLSAQTTQTCSASQASSSPSPIHALLPASDSSSQPYTTGARACSGEVPASGQLQRHGGHGNVHDGILERGSASEGQHDAQLPHLPDCKLLAGCQLAPSARLPACPLRELRSSELLGSDQDLGDVKKG